MKLPLSLTMYLQTRERSPLPFNHACKKTLAILDRCRGILSCLYKLRKWGRKKEVQANGKQKKKARRNGRARSILLDYNFDFEFVPFFLRQLHELPETHVAFSNRHKDFPRSATLSTKLFCSCRTMLHKYPCRWPS